MSFAWRLFDGSPGESPRFGTRDEAEAWLSSTWEELAAAGVGSVALEEDGAEVYRMSLEPDPSDDGDGQPG